jgi:hypothetical protein
MVTKTLFSSIDFTNPNFPGHCPSQAPPGVWALPDQISARKKVSPFQKIFENLYLKKKIMHKLE